MGCYRLYRIDLPNDEASTELIKRCYGGLNELLGTYDPAKPHATLDTGVYNAARILRVGGTWNRKGDPTSDRPHRICVYHEPDQPAEIVPPELIADLAALAPSAKAANGSASGRNGSAHGGGIRSRLLVADYLRDHGIEFRIKEQAWPDHVPRGVSFRRVARTARRNRLSFSDPTDLTVFRVQTHKLPGKVPVAGLPRPDRQA
jgi:hypothetical protein